jgi:Flp pilus assembly protein TadB
MRRAHADQPLLITTAHASGDQEFDRRRRKYLVMMILRAVCVIAATLTRHDLWIALAFIVAGAVLPWCAVLIANDRPAKKRAVRLGPGVGAGHEPALPGESDRTIDG